MQAPLIIGLVCVGIVAAVFLGIWASTHSQRTSRLAQVDRTDAEILEFPGLIRDQE